MFLYFLAGLLIAASGKQPHILLIVADDLGWGDVPWNGGLIIAPTLEELALTGVILDQHYVQPICTPTRSALMTGKYPSRLGLQHKTILAGEPYGLMANETIISNHLSKLGYKCHGVGKWHLGYCSWDLTPAKRGFDSFYGYYNGHETYTTKVTHDYFDFRLDVPTGSGDVDDTVLWASNDTYSTYQYAKRAANVIGSHDKKGPMFMYLALQSVHYPAEVPDSYFEMYEGIIENKERRTLAAMVTAMDDTVKVVVDKLKSEEMWNDTLLIFMSDNGGPQLGLGIGQVNYPLRGGKLSLWEGGVRSSSFIHSPLIPGGRVLRELLHVTDWLPTLTHIGACGVEPDPKCSGPSLGDIDGVNQWSAIIGASPSNRAEFLVNIDQNANNAALRWGPWKLYQGNPGKGPWVPPPQMDPERFNLQLISERKERTNYTSDFDYVYSDGTSSKIMLYNVIEDPSEFYEVSAQHPDLVKTILERLQYYQNRAVPPRNKPHDPKSDPTNFGGAWTPWLDSC